MIEDKLTREERRRLEAIAQAVAHCRYSTEGPTAHRVVACAQLFERYIQTGDDS